MNTGNYKYFYNVLGYECGSDAHDLVVASEKSLSELKRESAKILIAFAKRVKLSLIHLGKVKKGEETSVFFGDEFGVVRVAKGLKKVAEKGVNLPKFIRQRAFIIEVLNKKFYTLYNFPNGQKIVLREFSVYKYA